MFNCKMVCLDIDGTLLDPEGQITPRVKGAIQEVARRGIPVVLVSARGPQGIRFLLEEMELSSPIISYNGALIVDAQDRVLHSQGLPPGAVRRVEAITREMGIHMSVYCGNNWYINGVDQWSDGEVEATRMTPEVKDISQLTADFEAQDIWPNKLLCMATEEEILALEPRVQALDEVDAYRSAPIYLEVVCKDTSKALGIQRLAEILGVEMADILACGDNFNDLPMLLAAGMGVAMGNAPEEVKAQADWVTLGNDRDGVAVALEKYILS